MNKDPINLIVVDDEDDLELIFKIQFEDEIDDGLVTIDFFSSAKKCLEFFEEKDSVINSHLILTDINMPEMDGFELLAKIHQKYPEMPVYMISAYGDEKHVKKSKDLGAREFISKPVQFDLLKKTIFENFSI